LVGHSQILVGILVFEFSEFSVELFLVSVPSLGGDEKFNPAAIIMHSNMMTEQNIHFFFDFFVIIPPSIQYSRNNFGYISLKKLNFNVFCNFSYGFAQRFSKRTKYSTKHLIFINKI